MIHEITTHVNCFDSVLQISIRNTLSRTLEDGFYPCTLKLTLLFNEINYNNKNSDGSYIMSKYDILII